MALGGGSSFDDVQVRPIGITATDCRFNAFYYPADGDAGLDFFGGGWSSSGGNAWIGYTIQPSPANISSSAIQTYCGITNIQNFVSDGATGSYGTDDFVGIRFRGTFGGTVYDYEIGAKGVSNTSLVNSRTTVANTTPTA
ncbi:hypothetical protein TW80_17025, partial [Loktanella sp. S4079]